MERLSHTYRAVHQGLPKDGAVTISPSPPAPADCFAAVVFDMDGVIFDTEPIYLESERKLAARRGIEFPLSLVYKMMGMPAIPAIELMRAELGLTESTEALIDECRGIFFELLEGNLRFMPGFEQLFDRLYLSKRRIGLATSTNRPTAERLLREFDLFDRFEFVLTGDDVSRGKPDPEIYHAACSRLGFPSSSVLVIEDSLNGARAAKAAGCHCVVLRHSLCQSLDFSFADLVCDHLLDDRLLLRCGLGDVPPR